MKPVLICEKVTKYFGAFAALSSLSFEVFEDEILGIVGPNGAGKSTLFNVITQVPYRPSSGRILFKGAEIHNMSAPQICKLGIARTFQIPRFFKTMSVWDNLRVAHIYGRRKSHDSSDATTSLMDVLSFVGLAEMKDKVSGKLSLFDEKRLMTASALATEPELLLLDEPMGGLDAEETTVMIEHICKINKQGKTIIVIEHMMAALVQVAERLIVLDNGIKICEGKCSDVVKDANVIRAYLGHRMS